MSKLLIFLLFIILIIFSVIPIIVGLFIAKSIKEEDKKIEELNKKEEENGTWGVWYR